MKVIFKLLQFKEGLHPEFKIKNVNEKLISVLNIPFPFSITVWDSSQNIVKDYNTSYYNVFKKQNLIVAEGSIKLFEKTYLKLIDRWRQLEDDTWQVDRELYVKDSIPSLGFRLNLNVATAFPEGMKYTDLKYFAPPALYDKNDLDDDGIEDYLKTQNLLFREDRLNIPLIMAYSEFNKVSFTLIRADRPEFDSTPYRPNKERIFFQKTDVGSLGVYILNLNPSQIQLRGVYPFYEGEKTHALLVRERSDWGAFWPAEDGKLLEASYKIRIENATNFIDAMWQTYSRMIKELDPQPVELSATPGELLKYRIEAHDRYYIELDSKEDSDEPAGFVLNCHPQDGIQLSNIIQYGFTGQNILNAYNILRYGYFTGKYEYIRKAKRIINFFVKKIFIQESNIFYNLYNVDKKKFDFWWTGLLLPLSYAEDKELESLMGPVYKYREFVIENLKEREGSYLRCMNEDVYHLLEAYEFEKNLNFEHHEWLQVAKSYANFLLKAQEHDGSWYRAYDLNGKPIITPELWFGTTHYEQKSSTATSIPVLVKLFQLTNDNKYLEAARKAGCFVKHVFVDGFKFNGGVHDSIYAKGQLIDNESILFPMLGLYFLYKVTNDKYFWDGALKAAKICATWTCIWDVPLPPESTLAKYGFRSTGMGACDTCGAGYVHPFEIFAVPELVEISIEARDKDLFKVSELLWHGCNQTVATPKKDWGYKHIGLQEEGYLISWWLADDPMFQDTGFGKRWKGEGNKTCFPWENAVAVRCYWRLLDLFGTTDFSIIGKKFN